MRTLVTAIFILAICQTCFGQGEEQLPRLRVATDSSLPPISFQQEDGTVVGFDIDVLNAVTQEAGLSYDLVSAPWADLFAMVQANDVDLAVSGITINDDRKETYDFSVPYFLSTVKILALSGTDIQSAQDLVGRVVAVKDRTTGAAAAETIYGGDNPNIRRFQTADEASQAVANGEAEAYLDDSAIIENYANNNPIFVVIEDPNAFASEFYGFMFPKGSEWVVPLGAAITAVLQNGGYATIYEQWFGAAPDVALLLLAGTLEDPYDALEEGLGEETELINEEDGDWDWQNAGLL